MQSNTPEGHGPLPPSPPEAWEPLLRLTRLATRPLERFLRVEAASGILLLVTAALALIWANSPWAEGYVRFWRTPIGLRIGSFTFERNLEWLVNDGLMVLFFFVVGMEIRREMHHGELSEWRRAALPAAAALGGMVAPASLYLAIAGDSAIRSGWGVPMATDIAFAVGLLTLLGPRVPAALRVLLLALAVIDDLGAILVIAVFYSTGVGYLGLSVAATGLAGVFAMQRLGVRAKLAYVVPAVVAWGGIYAAGMHPTIAGVIVGLATPVRAWLGPEGFLWRVRQELQTLAEAKEGAHSSHGLAESLRQVDAARREALSPAESLIEKLHPWVAFGIMPIFAFANAGVRIVPEALEGPSLRALVAVVVGLLVGKPVGVLLSSWITIRLGVGALPAGLSYRHLAVLGVVAGVGFTMSLFIAQLGFADAQVLAGAKLGVLVASGGAAIAALALGRVLLEPSTASGVARTADEAESSTVM